MKIAIASDHAGYEMKEAIINAFPELNLRILAHIVHRVGLSRHRLSAARAVATKHCEKGILICGSGIGMSITANKVSGIRAALCVNTDIARLSRKHNDSNILVLAGRFTAIPYAIEITKVWLNTSFEGGRHLKRINKIHQGEK